MKFPRFLAFGSSLSGLESKPKTYRLVDSGLPRLVEAKAQDLPAVPPVAHGSDVAQRSRSPFVAGPVSPRRREGFFRRFGGRILQWLGGWISTGRPSRPAVQTELRLDAVRPLRSPLIDDDVKVVMGTKAPAEPKVTLVATSPLSAIETPVASAPEPFERVMRRRRWNRLPGWFRPAEKVADD